MLPAIDKAKTSKKAAFDLKYIRLARIQTSNTKENMIVHHERLKTKTKLAKKSATAIFGHQNEKNSNGALQRLEMRMEWKQFQWNRIHSKKMLNANRQNTHHCARLPSAKKDLSFSNMIDSYNFCTTINRAQ